MIVLYIYELPLNLTQSIVVIVLNVFFSFVECLGVLATLQLDV